MNKTKKFVEALKKVAWIKLAAIITLAVIAGVFCAHGESYPYVKKCPMITQLIESSAKPFKYVEGLLACYVEFLGVPESHLEIVEMSSRNPKDDVIKGMASLILKEELLPPLSDEQTRREVANFAANYAKKL